MIYDGDPPKWLLGTLLAIVGLVVGFLVAGFLGAL